MKTEKRPLLGILGGLGPMSSAYFYEMITAHTKAAKDQEHIDLVLSSRSSTPDRTAFITGKSEDSPLPYMVEDARRLEAWGADGIVIPCNTAHFFIDEVRRAVHVPVPSIIEETVQYLKKTGYRKAGIMATAGTVASGSYQQKLEEAGLAWAVPDGTRQADLHDLIYGDVKSGRPADLDKFFAVAKNLQKQGCDKMILGCTELSLINRELTEHDLFVDSLEVLAWQAIRMCGREAVGFSPEFERL